MNVRLILFFILFFLSVSIFNTNTVFAGNCSSVWAEQTQQLVSCSQGWCPVYECRSGTSSTDDCTYGGYCSFSAHIYAQQGDNSVYCGANETVECYGAPACNPAPGFSCTSSANSCGQTNSGTIQNDCSCSASTPSDSGCCAWNTGNWCTSSANSCGQTNSGTIQCDGSCSASTPANPPGLGGACTSSPNSCGQTNSGTITCNGSCGASTPANPPGLGGACTSAPNSCGQTNSGTITCSGCNASTPPESGCNQLPSAIHQSATCTVTSGTASDPDFSGPITVILLNAPAGTGGIVYDQVLSNPTWSWTIPTSLKDGLSHSIYAYAQDMDSSGNGTGTWPLSSGSPKSITCADLPTGTFSSATCTATTGTASGTATDNQGTPVSIEVRDGGPTGALIASGTTSGTGTAWSLSFSPTAGTLGNGQTHTLYAYARDVPNPPGAWYGIGTKTVTCAPSVTLSANPQTVNTAQKTTLSWTVSSGVTFSSSPSGWFSSATITNGSGSGSALSAKLTADTTFSLTAINAAGVSTTKTVSVGVGAPLVLTVSAVQTDACVSGPGVTVSWTSTATQQESYELKITHSSVPGGGTPEYSTGWVTSSSESHFADLGPLYDQTLYAHVRIKQVGNGQASDWAVPAPFTTQPEGAWPSVNFSIYPPKLRIGTPTQFTDLTSGNPTIWSWSFGDGGNSSQQNPTHTYTAAGPYSISLTATNAVGTCTKTVNNVGTQRGIPFFREIRP